MKQKLLPFIILFCLTISACRKANDYNNATITVEKQWTIPISARNTVPAPIGRTETGKLNIQLLSDLSLRYEFTIKDLKAGDALTGASLFAGNPVTNGVELINLLPKLSPTYSTGSVTGLRQSLYDSLLHDSTQFYFSVKSTQFPLGLARAQFNETITVAEDVTLSGANEIPPVNTTATGLAIIRLTEGRKLYSNVSVNGVEANDAITMAHIHRGSPTQNGPVIIGLVTNASDFGKAKIFQLDSLTTQSIIRDRTYINVHSINNPAGKIRGQMR